MKGFYTILVAVEECSKLEKIFNMLRIDLNDWDKTKIFTINDTRLVNYTILCEGETFGTITNQMNAMRVY